MHLTGSSLEHPLPSREYTQNLLQWIYDREPDRFKTNCFELHSVTSERRRTLVQVVFQFNFIIPSTDYGPEEWIYCAIPPEPGNAQLDQKRGKNAPFTAITVCCCVIATFLLLVLFLRCRSCFRRRQHNQKQKSQRFWYCAECTKLGFVDRRRLGWRRWPTTNPSIFSSWSEGIPLPGKPGPNLSIPYAFPHSGRNLCPQHHYCAGATISAKPSRSVAAPQHYHQQPHSGSSTMANDVLTPSAELDSGQPVSLAAGYAEYYRRQGKLLTPGLERRLRGKQSDSRAPTLRQLYQNSLSRKNSPQYSDSVFPPNDTPKNGTSGVFFTCDADEEGNDEDFPLDSLQSIPCKQEKLEQDQQQQQRRHQRLLKQEKRKQLQRQKSHPASYQSDAWESKKGPEPPGNRSPLFTVHKCFSSVDTEEVELGTTELMDNHFNPDDLPPGDNILGRNMCYSTRSTCHSHDSDPSQCSANACSDNQSSVFTTDASSPSGNDVPTNVVTLTIPSVNIVAESFVNTVQLEPVPTLVNNTSTDQITASQSDNEQDQYHPKMNRPSLCLFSARRRHRRGPHGVERPLSSTQLLRFSKDRLRYGELRGQYGKLLKVAPFELINSAVNLQGDSFASGQSGNRRNLLHTMNTTNPTDARSCSDLKEFERFRGFGNSYMSTDSTLSPLTAMDLPDVYLNPPSLSSLQSKRSSIMASDVPDFLNVPNATGHMSASPSFISMKEQVFAAPDQHQAESLQRNRCSVIEISNFRWNSNGKSRLSQKNVRANYELLPEPRFTHGSRQNIYLHDISNSNLTSGSCAYEVTGESTPYRDCSRGFGTLKRAFSLNLRSKGPKTLGAELQSIMDKHYEMTGIRMITASSRSASYLGLKNTNPSDGAWHGKTGQSKASKRRSSWSIYKEEMWLKRPTNMKSAISSLHLDCFHRDQMSMNKITPGKLNKSVLASLSTVALPCLVPLRSRLHSDTCSVGSSHARDITQTDLSRSEEKPMRRSSSVGLQRPSIAAGTPAEVGLALMGIHRPDLQANVHYQHG